MAPPSLLAGLTSEEGQALEARVFTGIFPGACVEIREEFDENSQVQQRQQKKLRLSSVASPDTARISGEWPTPPGGQHLPAQHPTNEDVESPTTPQDFLFPTPPSFRQSVIHRAASREKPLAPVPMLKIGDETPASKREPLIDEIASCLREWHSTNLHQLLLNRQYDRLEEMSQIVTRLDTARRQLHHRILTDEELKSVRESAVWDLVHGNRILSGEVIVRSLSQGGRMLTAEDSAMEVSSLQSMMSLLNEQPTETKDPRTLHHVRVHLKGIQNKYGSALSLLLSLCTRDATGNVRNVSEPFAIDAPVEDVLASIDDAHLDWRTIFIDLSSADITGTPGKQTQLILVIKSITTEPVRENKARPQGAPPSSDGSLSTTSKYLNTPGRSSSFLPGRRSVMFGFGSRKGVGSVQDLDFRPLTGETMRAKTPDFGSEKKEPTKLVKRITGIAALDVTDFLQAEGAAERELTLWSAPSQIADGFNANDTDLESDEIQEQTLAGALLGASNGLRGARGIAKLKVAFHSFVHSSSDQLIQLRPTLLQSIAITQKMGFNEAPEQPRSDIYITLSEALLASTGFLSHPRHGSVPLPSVSELCNLQLTIEVRNAAGDRIETCIFPSANSTGFTAWRTVAAERGERWNQTVRLAVPAEEVPGSHIVMSIADASTTFPFALCWMPLWAQDAFVRDGEHLLALHKYDEETSEMVSGKRAYLGLPWNAKAKDEAVTGTMATLKLETYLCSTQYSQDPTLLGIIKWRDQRSKDLVSTLRRYLFVPEIEVVKLLGDVLDALFEMLVQYAGNDEIEDLTFHALVTTLSIANDNRFDLQPRIDEYTNNRFKYPFAFPCLTRSFRRLLQDPTESNNATRLRQACKVGRKVFKFTITARKQQIAKEVDIGIKSHAPTIARDLEPIFQDMQRVMLSSKPTLIGTKTLMVQNFDKWLLELTDVLSSADILGIAIQFLDSCSDVSGKLVLYRLLLIQRITAARLFHASQDEPIWDRTVVRWTAPYWKTSAITSQQSRDQIRLCCSVVASQRSASSFMSSQWMPDLTRAYLALQKQPQPPQNTLSSLFPFSYPFQAKPISRTVQFDESLIEISSILAELSSDVNYYPDLTNEELAGFLCDLLRVLTSVLNCEAFPSSWLTLYMYHHKASLQALQAIFIILKERFLPPPEEADAFSTEVWSSYITALLKLVASEALFLETFQEQKRRAAWKIAGDVRELGAELLQQSWDVIAWESSDDQRTQYGLDRMGGYQVQYVPGLVGQVTELCLSVHEGLRGVAIMVLKSMILNEWDLSQDLHVIETAMITCLDQMSKRKTLNDGMLQKAFVGDLLAQFEPYDDNKHVDLVTAVKGLADVVDELLDLLVAVHSAGAGGEAIQLVDTIRLLEFLKDMQRESLYIGYVHRLAQIQIDANNLTEAGLALRMHADLYEWDHSKQVHEIAEPHLPSQTAFERKEHLYFEIIKQFEEGAAWQQALSVYTELAQVYATNAFDFAKLARTQRAMAAIYERIHRGEVEGSRFFRVLFRGMGFPSNLRAKEFIFDGSSGDRVSSFGDKLLQQYPAARIVTGTVEREIEGQYISLYPVGPQKDLVHPVNRRSKVSQSIRDYFMLASPNQFTMSSRRQASASAGVADQTQAKTVYTTSETFPNILRRSEIINTEVVQMSALQIGVERTTRKTQDLLSQLSKAQSGDDTIMISLTETLRPLVRHKSTGTVAEYWKLLPQPQARKVEDVSQDETSKITMTPLQEALKVALLDHAWAIGRCLPIYAKPAHQTVRAELTKGTSHDLPSLAITADSKAEFEATFAPILDAMSSASGSNNDRPWLWDLTSRNPESVVPSTTRSRVESDTRAGASEPLKTFAPAPIPARDVQSTFERRNGVKPLNQHEPILLSSRTSLEFEPEIRLGRYIPNGTSGATANATAALEDEDASSSRHSNSSSRQSRMGSMTKRLSQMGIGKMSSREKVKSSVATVQE